jgi:hypothetical protein
MRPFLCAPFLLVSAVACGGGASGDAAGGAQDGVTPTTYVASVASFQGFHSWTSFPAVGPPGVTDGIDPTLPRTAFINRRPPHGSSSFPVGTIIVKEFEGGTVTERKVFAMVKRGGDYNTAGATGWEWFELQNLDETNVDIIWRGVAPPAGESYAPGSVTCNACHGNAKGNDYVWSTALALSSF